MNDFNQHFKQIQEDLALSSEERSLMRTSLEELTNTPVVHTSVASPYSYLSFFLQPSRALAFLLVVAVLGGGTAVAAAETALPGDVLYSVKIHVNEEVETALALSPEKKATIEIRHAEERLQEIQLLAASGKDGRIEKASYNAAVGIGHAHARIKSLLASDASAEDVEAEFAFALGAHADILDAQAFERADDIGVSMAELAKVARGDSDDALSISATRVQTIIEKAEARIAKEKLSPEAYGALSQELMLVMEELETADALESIAGYKIAERHAYRILALIDSSERIENKTGKQVYISFSEKEGDDDSKNTTTARAKTTDTESATSVMMMAMPAVEEDEHDSLEDEKDTRTLKLRIFTGSDKKDGIQNLR